MLIRVGIIGRIAGMEGSLVSMKKLEKYLKENSNIFFGLAYSVLPDDLQAQQLVIDAIYVLTLKGTDMVESYINAENLMSSEDSLRQIKKFILRQIFIIGQKRIGHLGKTLVIDEKFKAFYDLNVLERASLYLKHKLSLGSCDISEITEVSEIELIGTISAARTKLIGKLNIDLKELLV